MKPFSLLFLICCSFINAHGQNVFNGLIKDAKTKEPLPGALVNLNGTNNGNGTDSKGLVELKNIPAGNQVIHVQYIGYAEKLDTLLFPLKPSDTITIYLEPEEDNEIEEITVSSTRSSRTIKDIPTRIELIGAEEMEEKANMKPGDIRMVLGESTGIQTLQTSPTSGNSGIRIQGLDGRYTQILKDGFPLYAGFSGGLGLMQTPPLDLKRVEIIKGASSTLYGGGAIAGLINLISKTPTEERELRFLLNGTSAFGLDLDAYYSKRFGKFGITLYAANNANSAYAPGNIIFTAIPKFNRFTFNPRLYFYLSKKVECSFGINTSSEERLGGDIYFLNKKQDDSAHSYFEYNKSRRISTETQFTYKIDDISSVTFKNSFSHFNREINAQNYGFNGTQNSSFTELVYAVNKGKTEWIGGMNLFTDGFSEVADTTVQHRDYIINTYGAFVQNTWDINKVVTLETGLRADYVVHYGWAVLPRLSMLYKISKSFSSRIGGGLGYKAPTIFTEESEKIIYKDVLPITRGRNTLERSYGVNGDINYKTTFADHKISFSANQLFFYTRLNSPLILSKLGNGKYLFENRPEHMESEGAETNVKIGYKHFKLVLGYTYTHSHIHKDDYYSETPLTPLHHTNSVLMYEVEGKLKLGLEGYYYSPQYLSDGARGRDYWLCGFMAEKIWQKISVYINFENMLDSRQTRFDRIYTGGINNPTFRDIYAPLDGFIVNGGVKLHL
jgi:iron complex outermembrane receptor protein